MVLVNSKSNKCFIQLSLYDRFMSKTLETLALKNMAVAGGEQAGEASDGGEDEGEGLSILGQLGRVVLGGVVSSSPFSPT